MKFLLMIFMLIIFGCGKTMQSTGTDSNNLTGLMEGSLRIPKPGVIGGGITLEYANVSYQISSESNQTSNNYVDSLYNNQINIAPITQNSTSKTYRAKFSGIFLQGPCPFNPMTNCPLVKFSSLSVY
jgi:hypothetical protein